VKVSSSPDSRLGASHAVGSGKKKRWKKKKQHTAADTVTTATVTTLKILAASNTTVDLQKPSEPTNTQFALELEHTVVNGNMMIPCWFPLTLSGS
jgi:hypothetical protein